MEPILKSNSPVKNNAEASLLKELHKGIESMEQGRTVPHDEAMRIIRERVQNYYVQSKGNK